MTSAGSNTPLSPGIQVLIEVMGYYKHSITDFEATLWSRLVEQFGDQAVVKFLKAHVMRSTYPPKVNEALSMLQPGANNAGVAFLALTSAVARLGPYANPEFEDPALPGAIIRLGGWVAVNEQLPVPEARFDYESYQKRFEVAYQVSCAEVLLRQHKPVPLRGLHAITNEAMLVLPAPDAGTRASLPLGSGAGAPAGDSTTHVSLKTVVNDRGVNHVRQRG